ncbi:LuxR C-terminal-related transcriptional regulator [Luteimicrobium sp. NPDC057192]|uniref:LuxR C-terminal-related transcriptional regulator n=1 Tax=Luteimicrobium sp. NPDC057192 TaxID=3346042 RepID=UPI00364068AA
MATDAARAASARQPRARVSVPALAPSVVGRPRVDARLAALVAAHPLTVVVGPAGTGKTTALAAWAAESTTPVAWLSVDRFDDDPARLHGGLLEALRGALGPEPLLDTLATPALGEQLSDAHVDALLDALEDRSGDLVLVLDDVHELHADGSARLLGAVVERLPANVRLVLASRSDPELPLRRLRDEGVLGELRQDELAFDRAETGALVSAEPASLDQGDVDRLGELTGGWPVALRLTLTALRGAAPGATLGAMDRGGLPLADYLVEEVLRGLPDALATFVLRATAVETIDAATALLVGGADGPAQLDECRRRALFLTPVGERDGEPVLRWHALFAAQCQAMLRRTDPEAYRAVHRELVRAFDATDLAASVGHALAAEDGELAAEVLRDRWADRLVAGQHGTLRGLLRQVPSPWRDGPELALIGAGVTAVEGRGDLALDELARAVRSFPELPDDRRRAAETTATLLELFLAPRAGLTEAIERGRAILQREAELTPLGAAFAYYLVGRAEAYSEYDDARSLAHLQRGAELAAAHGLTALELACLAESTLPFLGGGDVPGSWALAESVEARVAAAGWSSPELLASPRVVKGFVSYMRDELEDACRYLEDGLAALPASAAVARSRAGAALMAACVGLGDRGGLLRARAVVLAPEAGASPAVVDCAAVIEALDQALGGRARYGADALDALPAGPRLTVSHVWAAEVYRRAGRPGDAWRSLDEVDATQRTAQLSVNWETTAAMLAWGERDTEAAHGHLARALDDAADRGIRRPFAERDDVEPLLRAHLARGTAHDALVAELLDGRGDAARPRRQPAVAKELSARELEVLRELRSTRSTTEIAATLFVSVNTVKTHTRSIYRKLGVRGRREALQTALAAGLLE